MKRLRRYWTTVRRILRYRNANWYFGKRIRWLLEDKNGTSVYCDSCGNIANAVKREYFARPLFGGITLNVPICKGHAEKLIADGTHKLNGAGFIIYPSELPDGRS